MDKIPGVVIIRNILTEEEQLKLIDIVKRKGSLKDDEGNWNFFGIRGRCFYNINDYPIHDIEFLKFCSNKFKTEAEEMDETLIWSDFTHLLSLWYPNNKGMKWHKDGYGGNDGDEGAPVYSLTLGNSCIFEYKLEGGNKISVQLDSGDLIVFGGPQRLMYHSVKSVIKGSFKLLTDFDARINLTFRTCSDLTDERMNEYTTEVYTKNLLENWNKNKTLT